MILVSLDKVLHRDNKSLIPLVSNSTLKSNVLRLFSILEIKVFRKSVDHAPFLQKADNDIHIHQISNNYLHLVVHTTGC